MKSSNSGNKSTEAYTNDVSEASPDELREWLDRIARKEERLRHERAAIEDELTERVRDE